MLDINFKKIFKSEMVEKSYFELKEPHVLTEIKPIKAYWWDTCPNFGDVIGPWLIAEMTKKTIINIKGKQSDEAIFSVGSIIEHIDRNYSNNIIWGSGLIQPLDDNWLIKRKLKKSSIKKVCAVRGKLTQYQLKTKLGWDVPDIYGDPALLLPRYYQPQSTNLQKKIAICPHFSHKLFFNNLKDSEMWNVLDVCEHPQKVVSKIVNSSCCISTSLHGIIVAQAYGVPWLWLNIRNNELIGGEFKFLDFFSVLKEENIPSSIIDTKDITSENLLELSKKSRLLTLNISLDDLVSVFPYNTIN